MRRHWAYLKLVLRHKWFVLLACFQFRVPIWSALLHDWDKFLPSEWFPYARASFESDGTRRPSMMKERTNAAFALAWMLHQHRNKHHWQYWLIYGVAHLPNTNVVVWGNGDAQQIIRMGSYEKLWWKLLPVNRQWIGARRMPEAAMREMLADWYGAGRTYDEDWTPLSPRRWYEANKDKMILHHETRAWIEAELERQEMRYRLKMRQVA